MNIWFLWLILGIILFRLIAYYLVKNKRERREVKYFALFKSISCVLAGIFAITTLVFGISKLLLEKHFYTIIGIIWILTGVINLFSTLRNHIMYLNILATGFLLVGIGYLIGFNLAIELPFSKEFSFVILAIGSSFGMIAFFKQVKSIK